MHILHVHVHVQCTILVHECYLSWTEFTTAVQYYKQHIHFQFVFQNPKKQCM